MKSDELFIHNARKWHRIEIFHDQIVDILIILAEDFLSEIEVGCHLSALVVASKHDDCFREVDLVNKEKD